MKRFIFALALAACSLLGAVRAEQPAAPSAADCCDGGACCASGAACCAAR